MAFSIFLDLLRRTAAECLAAAVLEQFPGVRLIGGHATSTGFFYDFIFPFAFQSEFLPLIEERVRWIVKERRPIKTVEMMPENASSMFESRGQDIVAEVVKNQKNVLVELFQMGDFIDYCHLPYLPNVKEMTAFKLCEYVIEKNRTRLYGTAFTCREDLKKFIRSKQSLKIKDHIEWGEELQLYVPYQNGWSWLPKGEKLRQILISFWKSQLYDQGFDFVSTPRFPVCSSCPISEMTSAHLHLLSAHLKKQGTVRLVEGSSILQTEDNGPFLGLLSSRSFWTDQAHIYCSEHRFLQECISSLQFILKISKILSFEEYRIVLCSSGPRHKRLSNHWKKGERVLIQALQDARLEYAIDDTVQLLNGPRVEIRIKDILGREWSGPFIGLDCIQPIQFGLQNAVIVRSMFNSLERIVALLLEKNDGMLPFWLASEQARIIAVGEKQMDYAGELSRFLSSYGLRVKVEWEDEKLSKRMYNALSEHVPFAIVVGQNEADSRTVSVRACRSEETQRMSWEALSDLLTRESCELAQHTGNLNFEN